MLGGQKVLLDVSQWQVQMYLLGYFSINYFTDYVFFDAIEFGFHWGVGFDWLVCYYELYHRYSFLSRYYRELYDCILERQSWTGWRQVWDSKKLFDWVVYHWFSSYISNRNNCKFDKSEWRSIISLGLSWVQRNGTYN